MHGSGDFDVKKIENIRMVVSSSEGRGYREFLLRLEELGPEDKRRAMDSFLSLFEIAERREGLRG